MCNHELSDEIMLSNPAQCKCKKCGDIIIISDKFLADIDGEKIYKIFQDEWGKATLTIHHFTKEEVEHQIIRWSKNLVKKKWYQDKSFDREELKMWIERLKKFE